MDRTKTAPEDSRKGFALARKDLPPTLPVFPLKGFLLFPKLNLPLNIFEPRYISMVNDVLATPHRLIGMIQPRPDSREDDDSPVLTDVGCAARIASYTEAPDERYVIAVRGIARFRIVHEIEPNNGYRRVEPAWEEFLADLAEAEKPLEPGQVMDLLSISTDYFEERKLRIPEQDLIAHSPQDMVNLISIISPFSDCEKQALLEAPSIARRATLVCAFMQDALDKSAPGKMTLH